MSKYIIEIPDTDISAEYGMYYPDERHEPMPVIPLFDQIVDVTEGLNNRIDELTRDNKVLATELANFEKRVIELTDECNEARKREEVYRNHLSEAFDKAYEILRIMDVME